MKATKKQQGPLPEPTKSELEILQALWTNGPSTARIVNDKLNEKRQVIYMSTLKLMQIMVEKGFLEKDESKMTHVYWACVEESTTKGTILNKMVDNVFNGSARQLMLQLLGNTQLSAKERKEFEDLIKKLDQKK